MNIKQALTEALNAVLGPEPQVTTKEAAAILDALRESGHEVVPIGPVFDAARAEQDALRLGAQKERERLLAAVRAADIGDDDEDWWRNILACFRDPEDDR